MMDPYDDYDAAAYVYEGESDQECDIVYMEGPVKGEDPLLPYLAGVELPPSQSQTQSLPHSEQQLHALPSLLPRSERKRRRRDEEARELNLPSQEVESDSSSASEVDDDGVGAFASLQSLLEKQERVQQDEMPNQKEGTVTQEESFVATDRKEGRANWFSPPDSQFDFPVRDDGPDYPTQQQADENIAPPRSNNNTSSIHGDRCLDSSSTCPQLNSWDIETSIRYGSERVIDGQRNRRIKLSQPLDTPSAMPLSPWLSNNPTILSELEKHQAQVKLKKFHDLHAPLNNRDGVVQRATSSRPKLLAHSRTRYSTTSIVGSRPQHWDTTARSRRMALSQTTRFAKTPMDPRYKPLSDPFSRNRCSFQEIKQDTARHSPLAQHSPKANFTSTNSSTLRGITFTPAFLQKKSESSDELNEIAQLDLCQTPLNRNSVSGNVALSAGNSNGSVTNSNHRKRHSTRIKAGTLLQRLRAIRSSVEGERVRFQSGLYPFGKSGRWDQNDPRNRASSYMDVTIVGDPLPWEVDYPQVTVLAYVHSFVNKHAETNAVDAEKQVVLDQVSACLSWMCFTFDTAREQKLQRGSQLRIYNAIAVPSKQIRGVDTSIDASIIKDNVCNQTVVCTQLCEALPSTVVLPVLTELLNESNGAL